MKIGTDIIQINRIERSLEKFGDKFKMKFLNSDEIALAKKIESIAGFWAAKEAIAKALGCGIGAELTFHDIILAKNSKGAPSFILSKEAQKIHQIKDSSLSISHDAGFAIAVVVINQ
ncbi:holo-ACP synthase [Sulfurovum sp. CS9]|uniref:holo-ACP synthase n=1 Tax=Sulfurovum sp. CS9 TaxID=3391146 RepID=UPI0039E8C06E